MTETRQFVFLALAVAALSFTISKSTMPLIVPLRRWLSRSSFLKELLHCPYCTSHWVAAAAMVIYRPILFHSGLPAVDWFFSWQALIGAAMVPIFVLYFILRIE